jgi:hypothetical protein
VLTVACLYMLMCPLSENLEIDVEHEEMMTSDPPM